MVDLATDPHKIYDKQAAVNPTASDDKSKSFAVGCRWLNTATGNLFVCSVDTFAGAVWKRIPGTLASFGFTGSNGAGACTLTGATVGQKVVTIFEATGGTLNAAALFEAVITVADQIQQSSVSNLSAKKYIVELN